MSEMRIHCAMRKHGKEAFIIVLVQSCEDQRLANDAERFWIKELQTHVSYGTGYNMTWGGLDFEWTDELRDYVSVRTREAMNNPEVRAKCVKGGQTWRGRKHKNESCLLISQTLSGHEVTQETRKRISQSSRGILRSPRPEWVKQKISASKKGKRNSLEHNKKVGDAQRGKLKPKSLQTLEKLRLKKETHEAQAVCLFIEGKSWEEISTISGYTVGTVKSIIRAWKRQRHENDTSGTSENNR